jgi:hypothetical protein
VELVDSRNTGEKGSLRVEYSISEKKRKSPLGKLFAVLIIKRVVQLVSTNGI